jgi:hypothetical protein
MGVIVRHKADTDLWKCVDKRQQKNKTFIINHLHDRYKALYMVFVY